MPDCHYPFSNVPNTFERLRILGLIIVIRTFLGFSLQIEIEGRWPWQRYKADLQDGEKDAL